MSTKAGVGYSENPRSFDAGFEAAAAAMKDANTSRCELAIVYSTEKHDAAQLRNGLRSVIGNEARLIGGNAVGIITANRLGYEGHQVGVAIVQSDTLQIEMFIQRGLPDKEREVGLALGREIRAREYRGEPNLLLMYDSVKRSAAEGFGAQYGNAAHRRHLRSARHVAPRGWRWHDRQYAMEPHISVVR